MIVMTNTVLNTVPQRTALGHPKRWLILALILAVECMDLLDGTIVNVAAPSIRADLNASLSALQWIAGGYALTFAIGLVTGGRLGDIVGRRRLFLLGLAGFTAASALCGAAPSSEALIALRLVQGGFAAIMIPQGFGILRQVFPPDEIQRLALPISAAIPIGTLTRKIARQPRPNRSPSVSTPPRIGPAIAPMPITGPNIANAFANSSSSKTSLSIPKPCGISSAPNAPCATRAAISNSIAGAAAQSADDRVKPTTPTRNS